MTTPTRLWRLAGPVLAGVMVAAVMVAAGPSRAYEAKVHEAVTRHALRGLDGVGQEPAAAAPRGALDAFRRYFYSQAATLADVALRTRFLARYPDVRAFDALAFRELLGLTTAPYRRVDGIDALRSPANSTAVEVLVGGSAAPEVDLRHRDRLVYAGSNKPVEASSGAVIPYDPANTNLGPASGAASDAYAFTSLAADAAPDEAALETNPSRYAAPLRFDGPVVGRSGVYAATSLDLARVAAGWPNGAARTLALTHLGAALHYVQRASSPVWTVQLGSAALLDAARSQFRWRALLTGGGTLTSLRSEGLIAESFQRNHRRFVDRRIAERLGAGQTLPAADAFVAGARAAVAGGGELASAVVASASASASEDALATFSSAVDATCGRMRLEGFVFHDPRAEAALASASVVCVDAASGDSLATLDAASDRSLARAAAYTRAFVEAALPTLVATAAPGAVERLVRQGLDGMDAAAANRQAFIDAGAPVEGVVRPVWAAIDVGLILVIFAVCAWLIRRSPRLNFPWPPSRSSGLGSLAVDGPPEQAAAPRDAPGPGDAPPSS
jgi:hypothetical protein